MADDRVVTELVILGAERSVRQITSVAQATSALVTVQESAGVRQRVVYDSIARAAEQSADAQERAARRVEAIARARTTTSTTGLQAPIGAAAAQQVQLRNQIQTSLSQGQSVNDAISRSIEIQNERLQRQLQIRKDLAKLQGTEAERVSVAASAAAATARRGQLQAEQDRIAEGLARSGRTQPSQLLTAERLQAGQAAAQFTAARNAIVAQQAAAATLQGRLAALGQTIQKVATDMVTFGRNTQGATQELKKQDEETNKTTKSGVTYLSVLSAIHAASFLASNRTFTLVGSFATLGLAFGKAGVAASAAGFALGGLLAIFGQVSSAIQTIQQVTVTGATALLGFAGAATAAAVAAGIAGTKLAADVETQLASVRAFGGATTAELEKVEQQATEFSVRFGLSAADVVQATSLFARAGGTVEEAINGATEAIVRLQVASQGELSAAQAAIALSAALKQFSLEGKDAVRVADNLTAAAQASALSFTGVQQAFIQAAPGAAALGITIEDLSAAIALIGDQLIKGTTTGTAFKQFVLDLVNPTKQAEAELAKYGVTLRDAGGNALPFIDALTNLNNGLGDNAEQAGLVTKEQRATALAIAFGSRAFLAANILVRGGTTELDKYRATLAQVSTSDIVNTLLLPLNKQLERIPAAAQAAGAAFGGPLLQPARQAVQQIIAFLEQIRPAAELVGQTVRSVLVGQGFEALQVAIANVVGNNRLTAFLIELANTFRNVRDVIVSQIVPAVTTFLQTIGAISGEPGRLNQMGQAFDSVNTKIQQVGAAAATAIVNFGTLVAEFVKAEGQGGRLRSILESLAKTILTQLTASLSVMVITLQAAIVAMPVFARLALLGAQAALTFAKAAKEVALKATDFATFAQLIAIGQESLAAGQRSDIAAQNRLGEQSKQLVAAGERAKQSLAAEADQAAAVADEIQKLLPQVDLLAKSFDNTGAASAENARIARSSIEELVNQMILAENINVDLITQDDINRLVSRAAAMKQAATGAVNPFIQVFEDASGSLGSIFDNITAQQEKFLRELATSPSGTPGGAVGGLSQEELDKVKARIEEASRDISRRLQSLSEDAARRTTELVARALERLEDIRVNTVARITELAGDVRDRIQEIRRSTRDRREDRETLDSFRQNQEDLLQVFQRRLDLEGTAEQRRVDDVQQLRRRDAEDASRVQEQAFQDTETLEQRRVQAVQRAFDQIQQARELAFDRAQQTELTAFQRSQQLVADNRSFQLQLAEAKTPEDRAQLLKQRQQSLQDTKFQQGQEDKLTAFRQAQEKKRLEFAQGVETSALGFRNGLEDRFTAFRRDQEVKVLAFRRGEEAKELTLRRQDEDAFTNFRLGQEDRVQARRRQDAQALQAFQDSIENKRQAEEEQRIIAKAISEAKKIIAAAEKQAGEIIDKLFIDLSEQAGDVQRQIRNIIGTLIDLQDQVPPQLLGPFLAALAEAQRQSSVLEQTLEGVQDAARLEVSQQAAVEQARIITEATRIAAETRQQIGLPATGGGIGTQQQITPQQALLVSSLTAAEVILPTGFSAQVAGAVLQGIQAAVDQGVLRLPDLDLAPVTTELEGIRRLFRS